MTKIKHDLLLSLVSQFGFKILGFGIMALLARQLPVEDFGRLTLALSLCTLGAMFSNLGYSTEAIRKIASDPDSANERLGLVLSLCIPLLVAFYILVNSVVLVTKPDLLVVTLGIALFAAFKVLHESYAAVFIAKKRIVKNIYAYGTGLLIILAGIEIASVTNLGLRWIVISYIAGMAVSLLLSIYQFTKLYGSLRLDVSFKVFKRHVFSCFLLFGITGISYVHFVIDTIALGYLRPYVDVANFSAAATLFEASQFVIRPLAMIMFPVCALLCTRGHWAEFTVKLIKMYLGALVLGVAAWVFVALSAQSIIEIVYKDGFDQAAEILRVLYASTAALFLSSVGMFVSASLNREKHACIILLCGLLIKLTCLLLFAQQHGPIAVAWINLATQTLIAGWLVTDSFLSLTRLKSADV